MLRSLRFFLAHALILAMAQPALAQELGPNGGLLAGKQGHQTELLVSTTHLTVYVIDRGKPHDTKGLKIKAIVQDGGKTISTDLVATDEGKMVGKLSAPLGKGAIVVLSGKDDHGDAISARYVLR